MGFSRFVFSTLSIFLCSGLIGATASELKSSVLSLTPKLEQHRCAQQLLGLGLQVIEGMAVVGGSGLLGEGGELYASLVTSGCPEDKARIIENRTTRLNLFRLRQESVGFYLANYINTLPKGTGLLLCVFDDECKLPMSTAGSFGYPGGILIAMRAPMPSTNTVNWISDYYQAIEEHAGKAFLAEWIAQGRFLNERGVKADRYHDRYVRPEGLDPAFLEFMINARQLTLKHVLYGILSPTADMQNLFDAGIRRLYNKRKSPYREILDAEDITGLLFFDRVNAMLSEMNKTIIAGRALRNSQL